jgi:hypothetical protein
LEDSSRTFIREKAIDSGFAAVAYLPTKANIIGSITSDSGHQAGGVQANQFDETL